jgi:hypothetical protein
MYGTKRQNIFRKIIPKEQWQDQEEEDIAKKIEKAYAKMKRKALERENVAGGAMQNGNPN